MHVPHGVRQSEDATPVSDTLTIHFQSTEQKRMMNLSFVDAERACIGVTESAKRAQEETQEHCDAHQWRVDIGSVLFQGEGR